MAIPGQALERPTQCHLMPGFKPAVSSKWPIGDMRRYLPDTMLGCAFFFAGKLRWASLSKGIESFQIQCRIKREGNH